MTTSSMDRPRTPPLSFNSSARISRAWRMDRPLSLWSPDRGRETPILYEAERAGAAARSASAAQGAFLRALIAQHPGQSDQGVDGERPGHEGPPQPAVDALGRLRLLAMREDIDHV